MHFENHNKKQEIYLSPRLGEIVREIVEKLNSSEDKLYQRGGDLCVCKRIARDIKKKNFVIPAGTPIIDYLSATQIKSKLSDKFYFIKKDSNDNEKQALPTNDICLNVMQEKEYPNISVFKGITQYPTIREDGSINYEPGYDLETGYFYDKIFEFQKISKKLTQDDAKKSLQNLREIFSDFPFMSITDCDCVIAFALSVFDRPIFSDSNIPIFALEASRFGSGKSKIFDIVYMILTGNIIAKNPYPKKDDEIEKTIATAAKLGVAAFLFDNVEFKDKFGNSCIDAVATCNGKYSFRVLGTNDMFQADWNTVMCINGNNILSSIKTDTCRRVIPMRIEPDQDKPQYRNDFKHKNIVEYVRKNRPNFLNDLLTITAAWIQNGRPIDKEYIFGSFEKWAETIPPMIVWAGGDNILENAKKLGFGISEEEEDSKDLFKLLNKRYIYGFKASDIYESTTSPRDMEEKEISRSILEIFGGPKDLNTKRIGRWLLSNKGKKFGNFKLVVSAGDDSGHAKRWNIIEDLKLQNNGNKNDVKVDKIIEKDLFSDIISKVDEDEIPF